MRVCESAPAFEERPRDRAGSFRYTQDTVFTHGKDTLGRERRLGEVRVNKRFGLRPSSAPGHRLDAGVWPQDTLHTESLRNKVWKGRRQLCPPGSQALRGFSIFCGPLCRGWVLQGLGKLFRSWTRPSLSIFQTLYAHLLKNRGEYQISQCIHTGLAMAGSALSHTEPRQAQLGDRCQLHATDPFVWPHDPLQRFSSPNDHSPTALPTRSLASEESDGC